LSVLIDSGDVERAAKGNDGALRINFIAGEVVVADKSKSRLFHFIGEGNALSTEEQRETVAAIVGVVHLTDLNGIIGQEVVNDEGEVLTDAEETEHFAVVVKELLLGGDSATTKRLFHEFFKVVVLRAGSFDLGFSEGVRRVSLALGLGLTEVLN